MHSLSQIATTIVVGLVVVAACTSATSQAPIATPSPRASLPPTSPSAVANPSTTPSAAATPDGNTSPTWTATGVMVTPRQYHMAVLLLDGRVLVAGGMDAEGLVGAAELYDPDRGTWSPSGGMIEPRYGHSMTVLPDGNVLVAGGLGSNPEGPLASAELYDPDLGSWTKTGSMATGRTVHTATLLNDGKVLVVAGSSSTTSGGALASAEIYDPDSGTWTAAATLEVHRYGHTASLLSDGRVLVAGGTPIDADHVAPVSSALASVELYDPDTETWSAAAPMLAGRSKHTATVLANGSVLAVGGNQEPPSESYDPQSGAWTTSEPMAGVRVVGVATLLRNGTVLVAGGYGDDVDLASAELYDPTSRSWTTTASMAAPRFSHTATLLLDGAVLVAGGISGSLVAAAELYQPKGGS